MIKIERHVEWNKLLVIVSIKLAGTWEEIRSREQRKKEKNSGKLLF